MGLATTHHVGLTYPSIGVVRGEPVMVETDRWDWGVDLAEYFGLVLAVDAVEEDFFAARFLHVDPKLSQSWEKHLQT
jgi:hypothetical protein